MGLFDKNRDREKPTFANINLLGKCNVDCYFCLGKDLAQILSPHNQLEIHYSDWENFPYFLEQCANNGIYKLYITGQNCDSLQYKYLNELVEFLHSQGFKVGLRTNGFLAEHKFDTINKCELSTGYSIHTLDPTVQKMILGSKHIPSWTRILKYTERPRVQIVVTRCNVHEFFEVVKFCSNHKNIRYVQARRVSTDYRKPTLKPDVIAYEELYTQVKQSYPLVDKLWGDAEVYEIYGMPVCFWRTVKTTVNSMNYFTDGTVSDEYFIVEGYLKNVGKEVCDESKKWLCKQQ